MSIDVNDFTAEVSECLFDRFGVGDSIVALEIEGVEPTKG